LRAFGIEARRPGWQVLLQGGHEYGPRMRSGCGEAAHQCGGGADGGAGEGAGGIRSAMVESAY